MGFKGINYSWYSKYYSWLELKHSEGPVDLKLLEKILKKYKIKSILDFSCGTGVQSEYLAKKGYQITGCDYTPEMLKIAKKRTKNVKFIQGDMRVTKVGKFDAIISMFNSIGELSKKDFIKSLKNIDQNLKKDGLLIFDIDNLDYVKTHGYPKYERYEKQKFGDLELLRFAKLKVNHNTGLTTETWDVYVTKKGKEIEHSKMTYNKQIYSLNMLQSILSKSGFKILEVFSRNSLNFDQSNNNSIGIVAQKQD
jgi:SAM-dependent methyltransferase